MTLENWTCTKVFDHCVISQLVSGTALQLFCRTEHHICPFPLCPLQLQNHEVSSLVVPAEEQKKQYSRQHTIICIQFSLCNNARCQALSTSFPSQQGGQNSKTTRRNIIRRPSMMRKTKHFTPGDKKGLADPSTTR